MVIKTGLTNPPCPPRIRKQAPGRPPSPFNTWIDNWTELGGGVLITLQHLWVTISEVWQPKGSLSTFACKSVWGLNRMRGAKNMSPDSRLWMGGISTITWCVGSKLSCLTGIGLLLINPDLRTLNKLLKEQLDFAHCTLSSVATTTTTFVSGQRRQLQEALSPATANIHTFPAYQWLKRDSLSPGPHNSLFTFLWQELTTNYTAFLVLILVEAEVKQTSSTNWDLLCTHFPPSSRQQKPEKAKEPYDSGRGIANSRSVKQRQWWRASPSHPLSTSLPATHEAMFINFHWT